MSDINALDIVLDETPAFRQVWGTTHFRWEENCPSDKRKRRYVRLRTIRECKRLVESGETSEPIIMDIISRSFYGVFIPTMETDTAIRTIVQIVLRFLLGS